MTFAFDLLRDLRGGREVCVTSALSASALSASALCACALCVSLTVVIFFSAASCACGSVGR